MMAVETTTIVAWWGAIVATLLLGWDIYKHKRRGPRLLMSCKPDMMIMDENGRVGNEKWIIVEVANVGTQATTLKNLRGSHYQTWWKLVRRKPKSTFFVKCFGLAEHFPHKLEPGATWEERTTQSSEIAELARNGYLFMLLNHSSSSKSVRTRIRLGEPPSDSSKATDESP